MFARLIGSAPGHERSAGASGTSLMLHATLVGLAIHFTHGLTRERENPSQPVIHIFPAPTPRPPVTRLPTQPGVECRCPLPPVPPPVAPIMPPIGIPAEIPGPDSIEFGDPVGPPGHASGDSTGNAFLPTVEMPAHPLPGNPQPIYPALLRSAHVEGEIVAHFVVDSTGRVDSRSISFDSGDEVLFDAAVRRALLASRYEPARAGGRPVAVRVQQSFAFRLTP